MIGRLPTSTLFPYPSLFRSRHDQDMIEHPPLGQVIEQRPDGAIEHRQLGAVGFLEAQMIDPVRHRSEEHTSELQSRLHLVCRLLLEKKKYLQSSCLERT